MPVLPAHLAELINRQIFTNCHLKIVGFRHTRQQLLPMDRHSVAKMAHPIASVAKGDRNYNGTIVGFVAIVAITTILMATFNGEGDHITK